MGGSGDDRPEEVRTMAEAVRRYRFSPDVLRRRLATGGIPGAEPVAGESGQDWLIPASALAALGYRAVEDPATFRREPLAPPAPGPVEPVAGPMEVRDDEAEDVDLDAEWEALDAERRQLAGERLALQGEQAEAKRRSAEHSAIGRELDGARRAIRAERRAMRAERRQLEADRRDLEAERRQLEADRRDLEAERRQLEAMRRPVAGERRSELVGGGRTAEPGARGRLRWPLREGPGKGDDAEPRTAWVEPDGDVCPSTHPVKARVGSGLFRLPGMPGYERMRPDRCYGSEEDAVGDGLTRARR